MQKLGEYLQQQAEWTRRRLHDRAVKGASGYEQVELTKSLGEIALLGTGNWIGTVRQTPISPIGKLFEIDPENPLTKIALRAANEFSTLNALTTVMDSENDRYTPEKYAFLKIGLESTAYRTGLRLLNRIRQNQ